MWNTYGGGVVLTSFCPGIYLMFESYIRVAYEGYVYIVRCYNGALFKFKSNTFAVFLETQLILDVSNTRALVPQWLIAHLIEYCPYE